MTLHCSHRFTTYTQPHISCAPHLFCFATPAPHRHTIVSHLTRACPHHILPHFRLPYFDCPRIESNRHFEPTHPESCPTHIFSHPHHHARHTPHESAPHARLTMSAGKNELCVLLFKFIYW